jgi:hypothetical protein
MELGQRAHQRDGVEGVCNPDHDEAVPSRRGDVVLVGGSGDVKVLHRLLEPQTQNEVCGETCVECENLDSVRESWWRTNLS